MQIKSLEVIGLMGREESLRLDFSANLNILTGRNGAGKTSVLKLLWYMISGNILHALREVSFKKATLATSEYTYTIVRLANLDCKIIWQDENGIETLEDVGDYHDESILHAEQQADEKTIQIGSSVFFPTFRRIEGGFTLGERRASPLNRAKNDIEESLLSLSKKLSNSDHAFVAALSTSDIVNLLVGQYTSLSEQYNKLQTSLSGDVIQKIKEYKRESGDGELDSANKLLDDIRNQIEGLERSREEIMRPIEAVRTLATKLFKHSGIKLGRNLNFGEAAGAINSDSLSAGEKQMFSFIAYNAFYSNAVVFIDEPELSLHVDWQRQLFSILMAQQTTNQFIIATHSPFIYSKYPENELLIDPLRGDEDN